MKEVKGVNDIRICVSEGDSETGPKYEGLDPIKTPSPENVAELVGILKITRTLPYYRRSPFMLDRVKDELYEKEQKLAGIKKEQEEIVVKVLKMLGQDRIVELVEGSHEQID